MEVLRLPGGREVPYTIRRSSGARDLRLQVGLDSGLEVVVPSEFDLAQLECILRAKRRWILEKLDHFTKVSEQIPDRPFEDGELLPYLGQTIRLRFITPSRAGKAVTLRDQTLSVSVPFEIAGAERREHVKAAVERWYRGQAKRLIRPRVRRASGSLNCEYNRIYVRGQKTRWASCSPRKNLSFNWRLMMAPPAVIDYVVLHEMVHLKELKHSRRFWHSVESFCPNYREHEAWLKENGPLLTL